MSANRDESQKITFVYSNLYDLYRKSKAAQAAAEAAKSQSPSGKAPVQSEGLVTGQHVLRKGEKSVGGAPAQVKAYTPPEFMAKRMEARQALRQESPAQEALKSLRGNLQTLNELQSRLKFMLQELEEITKE